MTVGVPDIAPLEDESDNPAGRLGEIDHDVTVPVTLGVTVDMAMFCVKSKTVGLYEMVGADRPPVIIASWAGSVSFAGCSPSNQVNGFNTAKLERSKPSDGSSETAAGREASMMPADNDMVIIKATRNTDLKVFCADARDSPD